MVCLRATCWEEAAVQLEDLPAAFSLFLWLIERSRFPLFGHFFCWVSCGVSVFSLEIWTMMAVFAAAIVDPPNRLRAPIQQCMTIGLVFVHCSSQKLGPHKDARICHRPRSIDVFCHTHLHASSTSPGLMYSFCLGEGLMQSDLGNGAGANVQLL